jgi:hypothetical protein
MITFSQIRAINLLKLPNRHHTTAYIKSTIRINFSQSTIKKYIKNFDEQKIRT